MGGIARWPRRNVLLHTAGDEGFTTGGAGERGIGITAGAVHGFHPECDSMYVTEHSTLFRAEIVSLLG